MDKKNLLKKSNDLLNRITFFFIGMMVNGIILLTFMKLLQINGLILSLIIMFILNGTLHKKMKSHLYLSSFNLGLFVSNTIFAICSLAIGLTIFTALNTAIK